MKFTVDEIHEIITALIYRKMVLTKEIKSIPAETIRAINDKEIKEIEALLEKFNNSKW